MQSISTVDYSGPGRRIYVAGTGYYVHVEFEGDRWVAVERDEWGGFRRRLYDGREA